jgi:hypothetical protein
MSLLNFCGPQASWYGEIVRGWANAQKAYIARAVIP